MIVKLVVNLNCNVVLSNYLNLNPIKEELQKRKIQILEGKTLFYYLSLDILEYISKMKKEELKEQEVTILISKLDKKKEELILNIAESIKSLRIVTNQIHLLERIEKYLEEQMGIAIMISNNKRKSLSKSKIILNLDYCEEMINEFTINREAIIINILEKTEISAKGFCGVNILDYEIKYNEVIQNKLFFPIQSVYESKIIGRNRIEIAKMIEDDYVRITGLKGKNGVINIKEYQK